jgi:hypothetical protein
MRTIGLRCAVIVLAGLVSALPAEAAATTAAEMFELCNNPQQSEAYRVCNLYLNGFAAGVFVVVATSTDTSKEVCLPNYFNGDDVRAIFNRFYKSNESTSVVKFPLNVVLWSAISAQFPCHK